MNLLIKLGERLKSRQPVQFIFFNVTLDWIREHIYTCCFTWSISNYGSYVDTKRPQNYWILLTIIGASLQNITSDQIKQECTANEVKS